MHGAAGDRSAAARAFALDYRVLLIASAEGADIDVVPDDAPPERRDSKLAYQVLWDTGAGADVIVWERSRFERRSRVVCSLPATVLREGRLLYAA